MEKKNRENQAFFLNYFHFKFFKRDGLGSYTGTFGGKIEYFSRKEKDQKAYESEKPNIKTNPSKKGTGYG